MEKVSEENENSITESSGSVEAKRSDKEDERERDTIDERFNRKEGSKDSSNLQTVTFEDHHGVSDYEMEDEEVLELFRRNSRVRMEVTERNNFSYMNKSEKMLLETQGNSSGETEQTNVLFHSLNDRDEITDLGEANPNSLEISEGNNPSPASKEITDDSSSDSDLDSNFFMYYFDGSLPVSDNVEASETHQDECHAPKDESQTPLLRPGKSAKKPTSWRNCCGLIQLLRANNL